MLHYHGYTVDELKDKFDYEPRSGRFTNKMTGNYIYDFKVSIRSGDKSKKSTTLSLSRVAVAFMEGEFLSEDFVVKYKDDNRYNLTYDNLVVVHKTELNLPVTSSNVVETATEGVFYNHVTSMFIVRRGTLDAIYRTPNYKEAVAVRKEWEENDEIHKWDFTVPLWLKEKISAKFPTEK